MNETKSSINAAEWVPKYADQLYRFAYVRTKDQALSEDLVQETFLSALKAQDKFGGNSSVKTWLYAILRNKIIDHYRKASTKRELLQQDDDSFQIDDLFHQTGGIGQKGHWKHKGFLSSSESAAHLLESKAFYEALEACLSALPMNTQMAFRLKHLEDLETNEVCKELRISTSNYWVLLHRARLFLRTCLKNKGEVL